MLGIKTVRDLAAAVELSPRDLHYLARHTDDYVQIYELHNPEKPEKIRTVISPNGLLRRIQTKLLRDVFRKTLRPSRHSYGGVPGRNARQNANRHLGSRFVYVTDVENFFPSITSSKIQHIFVEKLGCSVEVGWMLTQLCTYERHLAQGLITSPILADQAVRRVDARIAVLCDKHGLTFSRFVDDITISGPFGLDHQSSGLVRLVRKIIVDCGFTIAAHKEQSGRVNGSGIAITGLRVVNGHLDVVATYMESLLVHLERHRRFAAGEDLAGPLYTRDQMKGRVDYVCSINPARARHLMATHSSIDWPCVLKRAISENRITCRKRLILKRTSDLQ